ncbi:MAG: hypothetical protein IH959_10580, partial [Chloroflexi bacterium]|nr:hypothetical protein [Chloroflexota bacterium]
MDSTAFNDSLLHLRPVAVELSLCDGWIGLALVAKTISEKGPAVTVTFSNAEGLEAGKTKVKYT